MSKRLSQHIPINNDTESVVTSAVGSIFRDGFALATMSLWDVDGNFNTPANKQDNFYDFRGNAAGASYLLFSLSPKKFNADPLVQPWITLTSKDIFRMPVRMGYGLSMSQRILGQEVSVCLVGCDAQGNVEEVPSVSPIAIAGTVVVSSNIATINTTLPHGLNGGDRVALYGNEEVRLNVSPVVVTVVTDKQFTVPCTLANGTYNAGGSIYWADPLLSAENALGILIGDSVTVTTGALVARRNGAKFKTVTATIPTTTALQSNTSPYTDAFNAAGDTELQMEMEQAMFSGRAADGIATPTGSIRLSQGLPDDENYYKLRIMVRRLPDTTCVIANIETIAKTGTTTATVVTDTPHGLVTGQFVQTYGVRDITNFPNLATPVACTVINAITFTVVIAGAVTANSVGGVVSLWHGSVALPGALNFSIQSIARTNNILTVTMNTTATGLLPGETVELVGMDGSGAAYNGAYKVLRMTGSVYELESVGVDFGSITCGGAVIKRTDVRLSYIRALEYTSNIAEISNGRGGVLDAGRAIPTTVLNSVTIGTLPTVAALTRAGLDTLGVNDIVSAAITTTATSAAIAMTNIQSCAFEVTVTAVSGTTPTMDVVVQQSLDNGTTWKDLYHFERITANGYYVSPLMTIDGTHIRYVRTVAGTTPSFTNTVWRTQKSIPAKKISKLIERTFNVNSGNPSSAVVMAEGMDKCQLVVNMGAITTTAPQFTIEGSEDGTNFVLIDTALTSVASSTVQKIVDTGGIKFVRAKVTTTGSGATLGYVSIKCQE